MKLKFRFLLNLFDKIWEISGGGLLRGLPFLAVMVMLLALFEIVAAATPPPPKSPPSDDAVNTVARQLYCPVCENISLDVCPTQACAQWRNLIRQKLEEGWTDQQIKDYFTAQYGDKVLAEPPHRGLNWLVYTLPPIFFLIAALVLYRVLRNMRRITPPPVVRDEILAPNDPYRAQMEEQLRQIQD